MATVAKPISVVGPNNRNTAAVVVLYHPEGDLIGRLQRVMPQVATLIVVANDGENNSRLDRVEASKVIYLKTDKNIGLAAALNLGLARAADDGYSWALLLDQDTLVDDDLIKGLEQVWHVCPIRQNVGMLVPNYRSPGGERFAYDTNLIWQTVETAVTSGSLLALEAVQRAGYMREAFFIEGIDTEYSLRLRALGLKIVASGRPLMTHGAGAVQERAFLGRTVLVSHHSPWRCFMQFRNLTWILIKYGRNEPRWLCSALLSMIKRACIIIVFERERIKKILAILRGTLYGILDANKK